MIQLKSLHGVFGFEVQRYKSAVSGQEQSYLELSQQFEGDHLSAGLRELIGYYSNRLSYSEVAQLVKRVSGTAIVSDQKAEQVVIATAEAISQLCASQVKEPYKLPAIAPEVDLYAPEQAEVLLFADDILVKRQAAKRYPAGQKPEVSASSDERVTVTIPLVMLQQPDGRYHTFTEPLSERTILPQLVGQQLEQLYGQSPVPLPLVAITDGARTLRLFLLTLFGFMVTLILDWYHLEKKVSDLMSMIALNKTAKEQHLAVILPHLWRGLTTEALLYLDTLTPRNPNKLDELRTYLQKHQPEIIDYQRRQELGKAISSGRMEKGCDLVVGHRQKKKGMSWSPRGSQALALLKIAELNHQWPLLWASPLVTT